MGDREEVNCRILEVFKKGDGNRSSVGEQREELPCSSCQVCGEGICLSVVEVAEEEVKVLLEALLVTVEVEEDPPGGEDRGKKCQLRMCMDCSAAVTSLVELFVKLEELGRTFNEVRRRIGHHVLVGSLGGRCLKGYAGWVEEVRSVEHVIPSEVARRLKKKKDVDVGEQESSLNSVEETETSDGFTFCGLEELEQQREVKEEFEEVAVDDFNEALDFCDFLIAPDEEPQSIQANEKDIKLSKMSPVVVLKRVFEGSEDSSSQPVVKKKKAGRPRKMLQKYKKLNSDEFLPVFKVETTENSFCEPANDLKGEVETFSGMRPRRSAANTNEKVEVDLEDVNEEFDGRDDDFLPSEDDLSLSVSEVSEGEDEESEELSDVEFLPGKRKPKLRKSKDTAKSSKPEIAGEPKPKNTGGRPSKYPPGSRLCAICNKTFKNPIRLGVHMENVHPGGVKRIEYPCPVCGESFDRHAIMRVHVRQIHPEVEPPKNPLKEKWAPLDPSHPRPHKCTSCPKSYSRKTHLKRHFDNNHSGNPSKRTRRSTTTTAGLIAPKNFEGSIEIPCKYCDLVFTEEHYFKTHQVRRHCLGSEISGALRCRFCCKFFMGEHSLDRHIAETHKNFKKNPPKSTAEAEETEKVTTAEEPADCGSLPENEDNEDRFLEQPRNIHCFLCSKLPFKSVEELEAHVNSEMHRAIVKSKMNVHCNLCRLRFGSDTEVLRTHLSSQEHLDELKALGEFNRETFCIPCRVECGSRKGFVEHSRTTEHKRQPAFNWNRQQLVKGVFKRLEVSERCRFCGTTFDYAHGLKNHMATCHKDGGFTCEFCGKTFALFRDLTSHRRIHNIPKPFVCEKCGKAFEEEKSLTNHLRKNHLSQNVMCHECGKLFPHKESLATHVKIVHPTEGSNLFCPCVYCPEVFKQSNRRRRHYYNNHREEYTKDAPHVCLVCFHAFATAEALNDHMASHDALKCPTCGKYFTMRQRLTRHIRSHTGERPFGCNFCDKRFATETNLKEHLLRHTGEKPHVCSCGKGFLRNSILEKHKLKEKCA